MPTFSGIRVQLKLVNSLLYYFALISRLSPSKLPRHMSKIIDHRKLHFLCETFFLAPFNEMACSERAASAVLRKSSSFSLLQKHKILLYPLIILSASLIFPSFFFVSACPPGKWGEDCGNDCPCLNGAQCNPLTGECTCTPGWHGNFSQF